MGDVAPCATIYVNNLNEKIKKDGAFASRSRVAANLGARAIPRAPPLLASLVAHPAARSRPSLEARDPRDDASPSAPPAGPPSAPSSCPPCIPSRASPSSSPPRDPLRRLVHPRTICTIILLSARAAVARRAFSQFGKIIDVVAAKTYSSAARRGWCSTVPAAARDARDERLSFTTAHARGCEDCRTRPAQPTARSTRARGPEVRAKRKAESQQQEREARAKKAEGTKSRAGGRGGGARTRTPPSEICSARLTGTERYARLSFSARAKRARRSKRERASDRRSKRFSPGSAGNGTRPSDDAPQPIKLSDPRGDDTNNQGHFEDGATVFCAWLGRDRGGIFVSSSAYPSRRLTPPPLRAVTHPPRLVRRGHDGVHALDVVPAVPGVQGGSDGGGETRIAFVEFESETQSSVALSGLQGFKINPTHSMTLSYAKK